MGTTLGWTHDPKKLIPGDVGKLHKLATELNGWSKKFEKLGDGLRDLKIPGWTGQASDAFWPVLAKEKANWYLVADAMSGAAGAVTSYASTLDWAQKQAATAIHQWEHGDHDAAETTLENARKQLKPETEKLTKKLDDLAGGASHAPAWLARARARADSWQFVKDHGMGKTAQNRWKKEGMPWASDFGRRSKEWGKDENGNWFIRDKPEPSGEPEEGAGGKKTNVSVKIAEWSDKADAWSTGTKGDGNWAGGKVKGQFDASVLGVDGTAGASYTNGRLQAGVAGTAYLGQVSGNASYEYGVVGVQAEGKAFAGAEASANVGVGKDGLHAGAEGFAGAKASGSVGADVAGVGAGVNGEAWAGIGASADVDAGMKDGKITIGGNLGVGLGVGGKIGFDVTVDPGKVGDTIADAADWVDDWL
ncbi:putative T7SS-secreted protein [Streptomyces sp. NPDC005435]|uniref:putative T7SS-secreted protein n=1 Tax=Streptomyces sp. NPDC005435 TaxID=3154464 RepID=UPI0034537D2F